MLARAEWATRRLRDPKATVRELKEYVHDVVRAAPTFDSQELVSIIRDMGRIGFANSAIEVLKRVRYTPAANVFVYSAAVSACEKRGQWEDALDILGQMDEDRVHPTVVTFNSAMSACARKGMWEQALSLFQKMEDHFCDPTEVSFSAVINSCKKGQWQRALLLKDEMLAREIRGNRIVWSSVIRACESSRQPEVAGRVYGEMKRVGFQADLQTYTILLRGCKTGGLWKKALSLIVKMKDAGYFPDERCYRFAIAACRKGGAPAAHHVINLFNEMRSVQIEPDGNTCAAVMEALEHKRDPRRVLTILEVVRQKKIPLVADIYASAMRACSTLRDPGRKMMLFSEMKNDNVVPNAAVFDEIAKEFAMRGQDENVLRVIAELKKLKLEPGIHACEAAIPIHVKRGQMKPLKGLYKSAVLLRSRQGHADEVLRLFRDMEQHELRPGAPAFNMAISACEAGRNSLNTLQKLLGEMLARGLEPAVDTLVAVMRRSLECDQLEDVVRLFEESGRAALGAEACRLALAAFREVGPWEGAIEALDGLRKDEGTQLSPEDFEAAIAACRRGDRFDLATKLQGELRRSGLQAPGAAAAAAAERRAALRPGTQPVSPYGQRLQPQMSEDDGADRRVSRGRPRRGLERGRRQGGDYFGGDDSDDEDDDVEFDEVFGDAEEYGSGSSGFDFDGDDDGEEADDRSGMRVSYF